MPETPRFLLSQKQYEKARAVFNIMARWNGKSPDTADNFVFENEDKSYRHELEAPKMRDLYKNKQLNYNLSASMVLWAMNTFNWYLLSFFLKYFPGNIF